MVHTAFLSSCGISGHKQHSSSGFGLGKGLIISSEKEERQFLLHFSETFFSQKRNSKQKVNFENHNCNIRTVGVIKIKIFSEIAKYYTLHIIILIRLNISITVRANKTTKGVSKYINCKM